jgi:RNA polymerase sigma-B factor
MPLQCGSVLTDAVVAHSAPDAPSSYRDPRAEHTLDLLARARVAGLEEQQRLFDEVVTSHLWLAESLARRFQYRGEDLDDLQQVARIGLVEACHRFDPERGSFIAFAIPTITGVLKRHFRDHGWLVRPPRRTQELASGIWKQWPALVQRLGTMPTEADLARQLGQSIGAVSDARYASQSYSPTSMEAAVERGISFGSVESEEELQRVEARLIIGGALSQLTEDERRLLTLRFFDQRSQAEIAAELGTSQMQVSRLLTRLLTKLRLMIGSLNGLPIAS